MRIRYALVCLLVLGGCGRPAPTSSSTTPAADRSDSSLGRVADSLRKATDVDACRSSIQQINSHLFNHPDPKLLLSDKEKGLLQERFYLDNDELAEVKSSTFTLLDAYHLDLCLLLHDAAVFLKAEQLKPLDRATVGFAWVMRQVSLVEKPGVALPPQFVLRRGWGNSQERSLVFLAMLDQLGVDGCMVIVPGDARGQGSTRYWIPGALVDKEIYLFDTRLGIPLPGPKGQGIATLAQVGTQPELLRSLTVDEHFPYDVTPEQAQRAQAYAACFLAALAPRMRYLQQALGTGDPVRLGVDPEALLHRFEAAHLGPNAKGGVQVWNQPGDVNTPVRVLRSFLPPEEGGTDRAGRQLVVRRDMIPWDYFPKELMKLPAQASAQLKLIYATPFMDLPLRSRMPRDYLASWLPGLRANVHGQQEGGENPNRIPEVLQREHMPHDLVLRGKLDEAKTLLVALRSEMARQRSLRTDAELTALVGQWMENAAAAYANLAGSPPETLGAKRRGGDSTAQAAVQQLWKESGPVMVYVQSAAAEPLIGEIDNLLALAMQEDAERAQAKLDRPVAGRKATPEEAAAAWQRAADWWETYLTDQPAGPRAPAARWHRARALQALGQREAAIALRRDFGGDLSALEKTGRLYQAKQLQKP
jgi:hypothetical protein